MAIMTALRHIVRDERMWQTRAIIAVESQVAVWALKKGRSSSRALNQVLQTMLGDLLSTNVRLAPVWVAIECNPADAPTRRKRIPLAQQPGELFHAQQEHTLAHCPWTVAINEYEWAHRFGGHDGAFDATRGYPGEGPRIPLEKMVLGPVKRKQKMTDLRVQVQPATLKKSLALDASMASYMQHLYNSDRPLSYGLETLAALQLYHPQCVGHLQRAWKSVRQWKRTQPLSIRAPLPLSVVLAMCTAAWVQGWFRTAGLILLAFDALLRPGEAAGGLRSHLILPCDLAGTQNNALLVIPDSKTAARTVQVQSVIVFDQPLVELLMYVFHADPDRTPLMPGGLTQFTRRFYQLKDMLGISASPWTPASLRGGGATSLGAQSYAKIDPQAQARILALTRLAPTILSPVQRPPPAIVATRKGNGRDVVPSNGEKAELQACRAHDSQFQGMCGVMTMVLWLAAVPPTAPIVCWPEESQRILFTNVTLHASLICERRPEQRGKG
eukprot:1704589-Amphidinium_carterae.1